MLLDNEVARDQHDVKSLEFNEDGTKVIVTTSKGSQEFAYKK